ncbi:MAG: T9SS type A sorting domain-containing protein [Bacteroidales bacterium]|jgi:hypothetical protein|nr:T9SS type A sorting domain-containing protein [Bacteroidales bacterium]
MIVVKIKQINKMLIRNIRLLLIAVSLLFVPFFSKAQAEIYKNDQGVLIGTSDSRMSVTVIESTDHIECQVTIIGEIFARAFFFAMVYDTAVLRLTDPTYTFDVPDGSAVNNVGYPVIVIPQSFLDNHSGYVTSARQHFPIDDGPCLGMKMFCPNIGILSPDASNVHVLPGEMLHLFSYYLRKVNPGTPLTTSDFGYYVQTATVPMQPMQSPSWMYGAFEIRFAPAQPWSAFELKPELFTYRTPSSITTKSVTNLTDVSVTLNASFSRGNFQPTNDIAVSEHDQLYDTHRLNWDSISKYGFIYADVDAVISVEGFSNKLNIDGINYNFPNAAEIAAGVFVRNGKTFHIQNPINNNTSNQNVSFSQNITGLSQDVLYYAWPFIFYSFETSNDFLNVGNKVIFQTSPDLFVDVENFIYCDGEEVPEYTFTGSENTNFIWERFVGHDLGLPTESGINTIPAFVATNYGFEAISAMYTVTPVSEFGFEGEPQFFMITVNPRPVTSPVEDMVYCNATTAPRFDFTSNIPDAYYEWEFVNETGSTMIPGVPESGENYIPTFEAYNTGSEPLSGKYKVRASYSFSNLTCYAYEWEYFNIVILPTPEIPTVAPLAQTICSGEATTPITFSGNVEEVTYAWTLNSGDILPGFPTNGTGNISSYNIVNNQLLTLSATYNAVAVLDFENYPAYTCESNKAVFGITVHPTPHTDPVPNFVYCNGETVPLYNFNGSNALATYTWEYVSGANLGIPTNGNNSFPSFMAMNAGNEPLVAHFRVQASYAEYCTQEDWVLFSITILPTPTVTVTPEYQAIISGGTINDIVFSSNVGEAIYKWERTEGFIAEIPFSGEGNITGMPIYNHDLTPIFATYSVAPKLNYADYPGKTCTGETAQFTVKVYPEASADTVPDFVYCNGETTPTYNFKGSNAFATYTWEFVSGADFGIPTSGNNSFPSFVAMNNGNIPLTANYRVRAIYSDYTSEWELFSVTVLPTPTVVSIPAHQTICSGETTTTVEFSGNVTNTTYYWTKVSGIIPELPLEGTGNFEGYTIENTGSINMEVVYQVTPTLNYPQYPGYTCTGNSTQFSITVLPQPKINTIPEMVYCTGERTPGFEFGNLSGVSYTWKLMNGVNVGLAESGTGQLPSFVAGNNTHNEILEAVYEVTATYSMYGLVCTHSEIFSIFVNPIPSVELNIGPYQFCANEETPVIDLVAAFETLKNIEGTIYEWTYISDNNIGIEQTSGTNEIPSFVAINNGTQQITALFSVKARFSQCYSVEKIFKINVEPMPAVISQTDAGTICSGAKFEYAILTSFPVNTIAWERAPHTDINDNEGASGNTDLITEKLYNKGTSDITVTYKISIVAGECEYENVGEVYVVVKPGFELNITPVILACEGEPTAVIKYDIDLAGIEYTLLFDPIATAEGWVSISNFTSLPESEIEVMIPSGAKIGNYNATLTLRIGDCIDIYNIVIAIGAAPVIKNAADTEITLCKNEQLYLFVEVEGNVQYQWYYEGNIIPNETLSYYESVFDEPHEGVYSVAIQCDCGTIYYYFNVKINPVIIEMKWDDVMYIDNSQSNYVAYQWYKDGKAISDGGQSQYYTEKGGFTPFAEYNLRAYRQDGSYDEACPIVPNDGKTENSGFIIYPNPSITGNIVTFLLQLPHEEEPYADVLVYDVNSKLVKQFVITNYKTEVMFDEAAGTYLVKVTTKNGTEFIEKIIIHKK